MFWYKRKRYGWGWVPVTWQAWVLLFVHIVFLLVMSRVLLQDVPPNTYQKEVGIFLLLVALSTCVHICISYKKAPIPKWRWGSHPSDDPKRDY